MLLLKAHCESCNKALSASNAEAKICSFECTFCIECSDGKLGGLCPNCGGELVNRPTRGAHLLEKYPAQSN
ncbi:DUF1272 domain-containing protein [Alteromonadaceae bacterium BrNp21-10]|nr:DUF1272 domain-containing protein [Alteromonadaceae bacterium BrNp21-10]